jgi:hypothetical protein
MIKLYYPYPNKLKSSGAKPTGSVSLRWTDQHSQSHYDHGVLLYDKSSDIFDGAALRAARDIFGARLVYNGIERRNICGALGVPQDEPGIIEAYTQAQWAERNKISRQAVNEQIERGKLKTILIGEHILILSQ